MRRILANLQQLTRHTRLAWFGLGLAVMSLLPSAAQALPLFNRQTGQNCVACHAGGQFPELTPYGRMFKLTGYTIGERTAPVSAMALASVSKVSNTSHNGDPNNTLDFSKNGSLILPTASLFLGGKLSDNIGAFAQITYDNYAYQDANGTWHGHSGADNIDIRYADRFIDDQRDLIVGVSLNNNPSVSDPWNTAAAWMQYVPVPSPGSSQFIDGAAPYPGYASGGGVAGITAYAYLNRSFYAELGGYRTANGVFRPLSAGGDPTVLDGFNPYARLTYTRDWGAHNLMVGVAGMDTSMPNAAGGSDKHLDWMVDSQYQYLLDPHTVTAQFSYSRNHTQFAPLAETPDEASKVLRAKVSYVYQARYGGSLGLFNLTGVPGTSGNTLEAFWTPLQYLRLGAQYTMYGKFNGLGKNYDGYGRNASDNNSLFFYVWAAY